VTLLKLVCRGPVAKAAAAILEQRIQDAEEKFAAEASLLEAETEKAIGDLEEKLEADKEAALQEHVNRIFAVAS
jgi:hypothetical protein